MNTLYLTELLLCMFLMWLSFWTADCNCEPFIYSQPVGAEVHLRAQRSGKSNKCFTLHPIVPELYVPYYTG